jgi:hypothetical protein
LALQNTRLTPPLSTTPLAVKVIVSPTHTTGGSTSIVPPESAPFFRHPSHSCEQHSPLPQQNCGSQQVVFPQHTSEAEQMKVFWQAPLLH